ncbi:MAG: hypothetical protein IAF00_02760 [Phycisphaerales bacterium]|nr:hypothetical protein [Phycisphaerales bacterium]
MTRSIPHAQRTRRLLNQGAMQRSHRRSELIRYIMEEAEGSAQLASDPKSRIKDRESTETPL